MKNLFFFVFIILAFNKVSCQNLNRVCFDQISFADVTIKDNTLKLIEKKLGKPLSIRTYGPVMEWHDGSVFYEYDSMEVYFEKYGDVFSLIHIRIELSKYPVKIEGENYYVGDSIDTLRKNFPLSFEYFMKAYANIQTDKLKDFYLHPCAIDGEIQFCGNLTIKVQNDTIRSFFINFTDGN